MQCPNCGNPIESNDSFCGECGHKIEKRSQTVSSVEKDISNAKENGLQNDSNTPDSDKKITNSPQESNESNTIYSRQHKHQSNEHAVNDNHLENTPEQTSHQQQPHNNMYQQHPNQYQQPQSNTTNTYHNQQQQYNQSYSDPQQSQQAGQFSNHAKEVTEESKGFFKSAFVAPDQVLKSHQAFSFKLLFSLLIIGLLVVAILLALAIPSSIGMFETPKSTIISSVVIGIIVFLAVIIGATYGITRLVVRQPITFRKVLSDFVLINTVSVAVLVISLILMFANSYSFGGALFMLSNLLIVVSGVYMIAKYSANHDTRFSSFYGVIIYIIIFFLFVTIFGESLFNQIFGNLLSEFNNLFDGSSIY